MKYFKIKWKNIKSGITLINSVTVNNTSNDIGIYAKEAANLFINRQKGGWKKNEIIEMQEVNEKGESIGLPIRPQGENVITPEIKI